MIELNFRFCCLGSIHSVDRRPPDAEDNTGRNVVGAWSNASVLTFPKWPGQIAMDFANETDVLSFTKRYGPLHNPVAKEMGLLVADGSQMRGDSGPLPSGWPLEFRFSEAEWKRDQERFRMIWETLPTRLTPGSKMEHLSIPEWPEQLIVRPAGFQLPVRGEFRAGPKGLVFRAAELWGLLLLDLLSVQRKKLKKCACPTCPSPYFVAQHLKAKFCERQECRRWGRNQSKLKWWNENRRDVGASSSRKGGGKHGTQKTR